MKKATQQELTEEAKRFLRMANKDMVALNVLCDSPEVDLSIICFHAQQAVEKLIKAVLIFHASPIRKTHDLEELSKQLSQIKLLTPLTGRQLKLLNPCAVIFRYDDTDIMLTDREELTEIVEHVQKWAERIIK